MNLFFENYKRWISLLAFIPFLIGLYFIGWALLGFLRVLGFEMFAERSDLIGTLISFILFLIALPTWIRLRWGYKDTWGILGVDGLFTKKGIYLFF